MLRNPVLKRSSLLTGFARLGMILVLLIAVMGIMPVPVARADNYVVSNTNDSGGGSLRQAILDANARPGYDTVTFTTSGTITLGSALPQITDDVTITGPGVGSLSVHGADTHRIFDIAAGKAVTITGVTIRNGNAANGGGIYNSGTLVLGDSAVANNAATNNGGGIYNDSTGTVTIYNTSVTTNTITGIATSDGGGAVMNLGTLTLDSSTLSSNHSESRGGGIRNEGTLTVTNSTIANNTTDAHGGGIYSVDGPVSIVNSKIANNVADFDDYVSGQGGGIQFIANTASVTLTLESSTVSGNTARDSGGGIQNVGFGLGFTATMVITNSTISANAVRDYGGGISSVFNVTNQGTSVTEIANSTIANNTADSDDDGNGNGGGIYTEPASGAGSTTVYIRNTIIADNIDATTMGSIIPDCSGTLNSRDYNLIEVTTGCTVGGTTANNITGQDPNLGPLADNGGDTETHALLPVSPAVDAGTCVGAPAADQRGVSRPQGAACDIGAYEAEVELAVTKTVDDDTPEPQQPISYTVTVSNISALTATNVLISDTLPTDLTFATGSITLDPPGAGTAGTAPPILAHSVTIGPGQQVAVTFSATVNAGTSADTVIDNTAAVTSTEVVTPQTALETLTVSNAAPVAQDDSDSTDESGPPVLISVLANDTDANGDTISIGKVGAPAPNFGSVSISGTTQITYTPANRTGDYDAVFTYTVSDGSLTDTGVVTVTVTADNDGLTASDDSDSITEDETGIGTVVAVDEDENDTLSYGITAQPAYGSADINASTGMYTYTPANLMAGYAITFTVTVSDTATPIPHTDTALVTVMVTADNDGLTANDDSDSITEEEIGSGTVVAVDEDEDDTLTYGITAQPAYGSAGINATTGDWTYTPANRMEDYVVNFTVTVNDTATPIPHTDTALVTVIVTADNDGLTASDDSASITEEEIGSGTVVAIDQDEDDTLTYGITTQPAYGSADINASTGDWTYTPVNRMDGYTVTFTVTVSDTATPTPNTDTALVTVMVTADNDGLTANDDDDTTTEDGTGSGTVVAIDQDEDDTLTYGITTQPAYGSAGINATTGDWTYTPANRTETYGVTFIVTVSDTATPTPNTDTALVTVIVTADNDGLTASDDSASITEEEIGGGTIVAIDEDENDTLSYGISIQPVYGSADINETGEWTYTPANRAVDYLDFFRVVVSDTATPTPHTATAIVNVTVSADEDPPVAVNDTVGTPEDTPRTIFVLDNDIDPENAPLTVIAVGIPITGSASTDGTSVTYTPTLGFLGMDVFTYTIRDDGNLTDTATVYIYVGNAPPIANDDAYTTTEDEVLSVPAPGVLGNDIDIDGPTFSVVSSSGTLGLVTVRGDGSFDFDPRGPFDHLLQGDQAFAFFTYVVSDGVLTDTAAVTITINGVDDAPVANDDAYGTTKDKVLSVAAPGVLGNDTDPDSPILSVVSTSGTLGLVTVSGDGSFDFDPRGLYDHLEPGEREFLPFTYIVSDGVLTDTATVTITISGGGEIYLPLVTRN